MKFLKYVINILFFTYLLFTFIAPPIVDGDQNTTTLTKPYIASAKATQLVKSLTFIGDLHCDALLWDRKLYKENDYGHVDFPRMRKGNMAFQAFTIVTKSPTGQNFDKNSAESFDMITALAIGQGQWPTTWFSLKNRALYQCKKLHKYAKKDEEKVIVVKSKQDFEKLLTDRNRGLTTIGGMLGIEGGHCLEGEIKNVEKVYKAGVRMLGPTHFFDNELGGSAHGEEKGGFTSFGFEVMKEMEKKNMIIDVAHASSKMIDEIIRDYKGPILSSHTGVDGTHPSSRNLSDQHLRGIAERGGLVGIAYFKGAVGSVSIPAIVNAMVYTKNLIGVEFVALGSDYDGSVTVPFDVEGLPLLVDEMFKQGFSEVEVKAILGDNLRRFLLKHLPQ